MMDILRQLSRAERRRLNPGEWIAWGKSNWDNNPVQPEFAFWGRRSWRISCAAPSFGGL
jgi:hypothetical protein